MLGNVVAQLHLHIVLRNKDDPAWPGPVWGWKSTSNLDEETKQIRSKLIVQYLK
jgi:diadenosine tetraphosphate (Ap4A) HIT family hydrolase